MLKTFTKDSLQIKQFVNREAMGQAAADTVALAIAHLLSEKDEVNIVFAAAPSQNEFLAALRSKTYVEWNRINAFQMDEYIGLSSDASQRFGNFLNDRLFDLVPFKSINYLNGNADDVDEEAKRYAGLLTDHKTDIACLGIGENGHLAFNDPPVADFNDKQIVKVVALDDACRQQQVNDGCFTEKNEVPTHALTLTIPALCQAKQIFCVAPGKTKANAVFNTLNHEISTKVPSTILRNQNNTILFIDNDSGRLL